MEFFSYFSTLLSLFLLLGNLLCHQAVRVPFPSDVCPSISAKDFIFASSNHVCSFTGVPTSVIEGDEVALRKVLQNVQKNEHDYVAILFYSSWCPFSGSFRPKFSFSASIFPSIPHLALEESSVRPSILSKYGVRGFPTLILLNSTMIMRYEGSRTPDSLISFCEEVTGIKAASASSVTSDTSICSVNYEEDHIYQETCPFPWAKSPENLLEQETYLALATIFVILRLVYYVFPTLERCTQLAWGRYAINMSLSTLLEHPVLHLNRLFNSLKEMCKKSSLHERVKNAKTWASKSLATVSIGDSSSTR